MTAIDQTRDAAAEFADRIAGAIDGAAVTLLLSIGHQTGLFDALAGRPRATSAELADAAGCHERYVREWLGGVVSAGIVDYDATARTYTLPPAHAAALTRAAGPANLACAAQFVPMLAEVEQPIIDCFRVGGGLPYSAYPRFHRLMAEESGKVVDAALLDVVLPLVDGLPARLAAGLDVADIGCGSGHAVNVMARAYPASRFTGVDFSDEGLAAARAEADRLGLANAAFVARDVAALDLTEAFDVVTAFDAIHDQAQPARVLAGIRRALRPGGVFLMVDIKGSSRLEDNVGVPMAPYHYMVSTMHCMSVSLGLDGAGLGTMWGHQQATAMLAEAGFTSVDRREVDSDPNNYYYVART